MSFAKEEPKRSHGVFYFLCALFLGLYVVRDIVGIKFSYYIIYACVAMIFLIISREEAICFFMAISALIGAGFNGVLCTVMLICMAIKFLPGTKRIKGFSVLLIVFCAFEFLHFLLVRKVGIGSVVTYIAVLLCLVLVQQYPSKKIDKSLVVNLFIVFSLFFVSVIFIKTVMQVGSINDVLQNGFRIEEYEEMREADGLSANQNYLTLLSSLNICLCTLMISKKHRKIPYILAMMLFLICALLTTSKMFFVVLLAYAAFVFVVQMKRNWKTGILLGGFLILIGVFVFAFFGDTLIKTVIERFLKEDLTTGRINIIKGLLSHMNNNPILYLFGTGILQVHYISKHAIHSSVFEILGGWGILGLILVGAYLLGLICHARANMRVEGKKADAYNYLPLLLLLGYTLIGMLFGQAFSVVQIMVCIYAMQVKEKK